MYDLYLLNNSFPTNSPPLQNVISASIKMTVEAVILVLLSRAKKGTTGKDKNSITDRNLQMIKFAYDNI